MLSALFAGTMGACDGVSEETAEGRHSFSGTVTNFSAKSLLELESVTVASETGVVLDFHAGGRRYEEFTPSHVREHMVLGHPVEVIYQRSGDMLLMVSLRDVHDGTPAPSGSP